MNRAPRKKERTIEEGQGYGTVAGRWRQNTEGRFVIHRKTPGPSCSKVG